MSRGESQKVRAGSAAIGLWAALGSILLGAGLLLAATMEDCGLSNAPVVTTTPAPSIVAPPLGDRDCSMEGSRSAVLESRGYRRVGFHDAPLDMPETYATEPLAGACGLVLAVAEPTSTLDHVRTPDGPLRRPCQLGTPASVGVCGTASVQVGGLGRAHIELFTMPGLTPENVRATGLSEEAALILAEGEAILGRDGYTALPRALHEELSPGDLRWDPPTPSEGCVLWLVAAFGFDSAREEGGRAAFEDSHLGRQLVSLAACAHQSSTLVVVDSDRTGGELYALPLERAGGPRVPTESDARWTALPQVRVVPRAELPARLRRPPP